MERRSYDRPPEPPRRVRGLHPSFSSSLLDTISRSIDESDGGGASGSVPERRCGDSADHRAGFLSDTPPQREQHYSRSCRRWRLAATSSSSSDCSGYGGTFSSSDAESAKRLPSRLRPVWTADRPRADLPATEKKDNYKKIASIRNRFKDLRRRRSVSPSSSSSSSPGARFASFLNSLFAAAAAAGSPKKPKLGRTKTVVTAAREDYLPASNCGRSCLVKKASSASGGVGKRSVRFCPMGIVVGEDCRPCGEKLISPAAAGAVIGSRADRVVEELLLGLKTEIGGYRRVVNDDHDDGGMWSDASSDLFELENLTAACGGGEVYRDELPVYETTFIGKNRAIAQKKKKKEIRK